MRPVRELYLAVLLLPAWGWPQAATYPIIVTVAGNGQAAYGGDGGPALEAALQNPYGVVVDRARNLYIADYYNNRVRKVTPEGVISTVAGTGVAGSSGDGGPGAAAQLNRPSGLALDADGNLYIAENAGHRVRLLSAAGVISTVAGSGVAGYGGDGGSATAARLAGPYGIALDASGNLYIADYGNHRVRRVDPAGVISTVAGTGTAGFSGDGGQASAAQLNRPFAVAVEADGTLYISDSESHRVRRVGTDGVISTVAGTGTPGYGGDGGTAASALIEAPRGLAVDEAGNLYIAEVGNSCVRRVTRAGTISTVAGRAWYGFSGDGGSATRAKLSGLRGVAVDANGDLYLADSSNHRIRRVIVSATGGPLTMVTASSLPGGTAGTLYSTTLGAAGGAPPYRWAVAAGELLPGLSLDAASGTLRGTPARAGSFTLTVRVSDAAGASVSKTFGAYIGWRAATGVISTVAGSGLAGYGGDNGPATAARLNSPEEVAVDGEGNLYIGDYWNHRVRRVSQDGTITTYAGTGEAGFSGDGGPATAARLNGPGGIALDALGNLYVGDRRNHRVRRIDRAGVITTVAGAGEPGFAGDGGAAVSAQINSPNGVAVDAAGNLYISDWGNDRVRKVTPEGIITTVAGNGTSGFAGDGGPATAAQLDGPSGLAVDAAGNLYIATYNYHRIRKVDPAGVITTVAGNGTVGFSGEGVAAAEAALAYPCAVAADAAGNLYIADRDNHRIRRVSPQGLIVTVAGNGSAGSSGDAGPGASAQLDSPMGVTTDAAGNLFVSETGGQRIRKLVFTRELPAITTPAALPAAVLGTAYAVLLTPSGGTPPYSWSVAGGSLPPGILLDAASGGLRGTPSAAGTYAFELRLSDSTGLSVRQGFTLTVTAAGTVVLSRSALSFTWRVGDGAPAPQSVEVTSSGAAASFTASVSAGADWITVTPASGMTPATLYVSVSPTKVSLGVHSGSITVTSGGARQTITVELSAYSGSGAPQITAAGIVHAATLLPGAVAPGEIVTLFGARLGPPAIVFAKLDEAGQLATKLAEVQVLFDNIPAPLVYVLDSQVSAIVPYAVAGTRETQVRVQYQGLQGNTVRAPVAASAPGIFTADQSGKGQGSVLNEDWGVNSAANPAQKGSVVHIYATGEGETDPQVADGRLATPQVLPRPRLPVQVTIGGARAEVLYAGAVPGQVTGLLQVDVRVPPNAASGNLPVTLTIGAASSPAGVTVAVR